MQELVLKIDSISNMGEGIAKHDGKIFFVKNSCPQDVLKVKIIKETKNYSYAEIIEIIEPSPHRVKPLCPMQKICGACQFQFIDYKYQLELKKQIIENYTRKLPDIKINDVIPSPEITEYRHKIQYPVSETKNSKRIISGYFKQKSHEIVNIKYCPTQPKICDELIDFIRENAPKYNISGYNESTYKGILRHIVIRSSYMSKNNLVILVVNTDKVSDNLVKLSEKIHDNFEKVSGVCVNFNTNKNNLILTDKTKCIAGKDYIEEKLCDYVFPIGATTFFQVNPQSAENIFQYVKKYISDNFSKPVIFDAYAGIATFGIVMSDISQKVVSVEENKASINLAKKVLENYNINNVELYAEDTNEYLKSKKNNPKSFDITILDPPRKGCTTNILDNVLQVTKSKIIYVSCNPQTLVRDLEYLISKGAKVKSIQPFDMFCHTYHIESVAIIDL